MGKLGKSTKSQVEPLLIFFGLFFSPTSSVSRVSRVLSQDHRPFRLRINHVIRLVPLPVPRCLGVENRLEP